MNTSKHKSKLGAVDHKQKKNIRGFVITDCSANKFNFQNFKTFKIFEAYRNFEYNKKKVYKLTFSAEMTNLFESIHTLTHAHFIRPFLQRIPCHPFALLNNAHHFISGQSRSCEGSVIHINPKKMKN